MIMIQSKIRFKYFGLNPGYEILRLPFSLKVS